MEMYKITKILLVIFLIFLFNFLVIFNGRGYLKQNESSIHQSEILNNGRCLQKERKFVGVGEVFTNFLYIGF
jgi:hypothetical protein